ncbi:MAG: hypothetical protein SNH88_05890 [Rikenellaceae bacterium]
MILFFIPLLLLSLISCESFLTEAESQLEDDAPTEELLPEEENEEGEE